MPTAADQPITLKTNLLDIVLRLESALPPTLFQDGSAATLVCLRNVVPQSQWESTSLRQILDGDDGQAGVVLTLDVGAATNTTATGSSVIKSALASAASSLNIKPVNMSAPPTSAAASSPAAVVMERGSNNAALSAMSATTTSSSTNAPMDIDVTTNTSNLQQLSATQPTITRMLPEEAWSKVLQSNFDAASKDCLNTLLKIIDNLLSRPNEPKVRSIRCANAAFEKKVGRCTGGLEFLYSMGFIPKYPALGGGGAGGGDPETLEMTPENESRDMLLRARKVLVHSAVRDLNIDEDDLPPVPKLPESLPKSTFVAPSSAAATSSNRHPSGFNIYKGHSYNIQSAAMGAPDPYMNAGVSNTERQLQQLQSKRDRIEREMQSNIQMDRGLVAYKAGDGPAGIISSTSNTAAAAAGGGGAEGRGDSSLIAGRMKRLEEERKKREEGGFTTKAMRDLERMKKAKVYSHAQIRINFMDGTHLHAKFLPREKVSAIRSVIHDSFQTGQSLDFYLYVAPPRRLLNDDKTLEEEELVPASKIHVSWKAGGAPSSGNSLRDDLFLAGGDIAAFPDSKPVMKQAATTEKKKGNDSKNSSGNAPSKEELLMQRMLGKPSMLGGTSTSKKSDQDGAKKSSGGKPKWFK